MTTAPKLEVLHIAELVSYQDGSVVSRQITKADSGNVTLFAFDKDQELSEHTAPFDALAHILDGDAEVKISRKVFHLTAGDAILMPANEPHALKALTRFKMLLTMIHNGKKIGDN
jgi:quercetin dioxygenase-like cupin family protein